MLLYDYGFRHCSHPCRGLLAPTKRSYSPSAAPWGKAMARVQNYFSDKVVLVTGATGLVGKVLVEKVLRDLPHIQRLYVLIRSRTTPKGVLISAQERLWQDVLASSAFDPLRDRLGNDGFKALADAKVAAVEGDLSEERLGLDGDTYARLQQDVQLVINCAAVVTFDAPLDAALRLNTMGPLRILEFARGCRDAMVVHTSTCYVNGTRQGPIPEDTLDPTETVGHLRGVDRKPYDVDEEVAALWQAVAETRASVSAPLPRVMLRLKSWRRRLAQRAIGKKAEAADLHSVSAGWVQERLVQVGMAWAHRRGWSDVYTFTKAMGEQMVTRYRGDLPVLILRPSIIESGLEAPQPGWLDGFRMLDPLIVAYGRERLPDFPGVANSVLDIVPADTVVNGLLASIPWAQDQGGLQVVQIASGMENPLTLERFADIVRDYFKRESLTGRSRDIKTPPKITFPTREAFLRRLKLRMLWPLRIAEELTLLASVTPWGRRQHRSFLSKRKALERLVYYIRIYGPYAQILCQYQTHNRTAAWASLSTEDQAVFNFDVQRIDWPTYIQQVHIPGIRRFLLGVSTQKPAQQPPEPVDVDELARLPSHDIEEREAPIHMAPSLTADADGQTVAALPGANGASLTTAQAARALLADALERVESSEKSAPSIGSSAASGWIKTSRLGQAVRALARKTMSAGFRLYLGFKVEGLDNLPNNGAFIIVSNHVSHLDTAAILVALGHRSLRVHPMAAVDYWFAKATRRWFVTSCLGAIPFDREGRVAESLALAAGVLEQDQALLFFPEGGRSATGQMQPFKRGIGLLVLAAGVPVVPTRVEGTFDALPKGRTFLRRRPVRVRFGVPILPDDYLRGATKASAMEASRRVSTDLEKAVEALV